MYHKIEKLSNSMESSTIGKYTDFVPFGKMELIARQVLVDNRYGSQMFQPLDRNGISENSNEFVHFVIVGMTEMGRSMAKIAALVSHYPNFETQKTKITFIDSHAEEYWSKIKTKYQYVLDCSHYTFSKVIDDGFVDVEKYVPQDDFMDIEWNFVHADVDSSVVQTILQTWEEEQGALLTIAICYDDSKKNQQIVMSLQQKLLERHVPIYVFQQNSDWLLELKKSPAKYSSIKLFGMIDDCGDLYGDKFVLAGRMLNYLT